MIKTILLDLDGTLLDSNEAHAQAWVEALSTFHFSVPFLKVKRLIGMGSDYLLPELIGLSAESELGKQIVEERGRIFREDYLPFLKPFLGARELVKKLKNCGFDLVVATSASQQDLSGTLKQAQIQDLIDVTTHSDEVTSSKPSPDIINRALQKTGSSPHEALMLGDTPYDVKAAQNAGIPIIGFTCGGWAASDLEGCLEVFHGPWDLINKFEFTFIGKQSIVLSHSRSARPTSVQHLPR